MGLSLPACWQQAELAAEHTCLGLGATEPSFNQQSSDVPPLSGEVQAGDGASGTEFSRKTVIACNRAFFVHAAVLWGGCASSPLPLLGSVLLHLSSSV